MKIKTIKSDYETAMAVRKPKRKKVSKPNILFTTLVRVLSVFELWSTRFEYTKSRMHLIDKKEPCLILMNHSSFIDLKIVSKIFYPKPYCIVSTSDGFVGKEWLMRMLGCIPTKKFVSELSLITDMLDAVKRKKVSVLMFPEASYSFDGCATALPRKLGMLIKKLDVPVLTVITNGAFIHDPLYNCLQKRKCKVTAHLDCMLTKEEIAQKSVEEIDAMLNDAFSFDNFKSQLESKTVIDEPFRADGLNRILYKCANCKTEGETVGKGTSFVCRSCKKEYEMNVYGQMVARCGETEFSHIPDWYLWQRECVKKEILDGTYLLDTEVEIGIMTDYKAIHMVGTGRLIHNCDGFTLTGCDGKLSYSQKVLSSYSLYADYYWYEIDDVICIGDKDRLYYCFPKKKDVVAKARIATEEMYKIASEKLCEK